MWCMPSAREFELPSSCALVAGSGGRRKRKVVDMLDSELWILRPLSMCGACVVQVPMPNHGLDGMLCRPPWRHHDGCNPFPCSRFDNFACPNGSTVRHPEVYSQSPAHGRHAGCWKRESVVVVLGEAVVARVYCRRHNDHTWGRTPLHHEPSVVLVLICKSQFLYTHTP